MQTPVSGSAHTPPAGERVYYEPGDAFLGAGDLASSCGPAGCDWCGTFRPGCGPFGNGFMSGFFARTEYLAWGTQGMNLPALVTTSPTGTARTNAGVLGESGTRVLFGDETVNSNLRSGGRLTIGQWFDPCQRLGVEADYFAIGDETTGFAQTSSGDPILARPFFDVTIGQQSAELIAFPNVITGTISAQTSTSFQGAGVRALYNIACGDGCGTSCLTQCPVPTGYRFDTLVGYRFLRVDDRVGIVEDLTSLDTANPGSFFLRDEFETRNQFHGVDFGTALRFCKGCWSLDMLSKLAFGNTRTVVDIAGSTVLTQQGDSELFTGGLLAQRTNIGTHVADEFTMVPELGLTVGYRFNPCWRLTFGYTFIYWSRVARAGDQIPTDLNPNLLPPEDPVVPGDTRPEFRLLYSDFWAQGMNVGIEGKW